ncbi:Rho guanine nucleotide exchange factor [Corchorus olitorius]|uniref:Rho guanine nucleotide exchange factor n=1 Tax=Corchorus olitorius TaxID=93759 RepID=A0A1R3GB50_9ROSI|nr:Rho guanine nucleotide exchange factor [Corchorus olitorius]
MERAATLKMAFLAALLLIGSWSPSGIEAQTQCNNRTCNTASDCTVTGCCNACTCGGAPNGRCDCICLAAGTKQRKLFNFNAQSLEN